MNTHEITVVRNGTEVFYMYRVKPGSPSRPGKFKLKDVTREIRVNPGDVVRWRGVEGSLINFDKNGSPFLEEEKHFIFNHDGGVKATIRSDKSLRDHYDYTVTVLPRNGQKPVPDDPRIIITRLDGEDAAAVGGKKKPKGK